jgi:hypothetical protein
MSGAEVGVCFGLVVIVDFGILCVFRNLVNRSVVDG